MVAFQVAEVGFQAVEALKVLMPRIARRDKGLADQLTRAATSVVLNIEEGNGLEGGNRRLRFLTAAGSARESLAALRVAVAWGYLAPEDAESAASLLDRVVAILWKLTH